MRVGIYNEPSSTALGGSEYCTALLADRLCATSEVTVLHHRDRISGDELERAFDVSLNSVRFERIDKFQPLEGFGFRIDRAVREQRRRFIEMTGRFDVFIALVHGVPPLCDAPKSLLYIHFPMFVPAESWPWRTNGNARFASVSGTLRRWIYSNQFAERLASYSNVCCNSAYTRGWTKKYWNVDADIVYPPGSRCLELFTDGDCSKSHEILSVGRFCQEKQQLLLIDCYSRLRCVVGNNWKAHFLGSADGGAYWKEVVSLAKREHVAIQQNASRDEILSHYQHASIFWHAMGYGAGSNNPARAEHFGIVTVEAMAAGCIPVAFNGGGQPEIVEHEKSGFLWNTPDELIEYTRRLIENPSLRTTMANAARRRAGQFSADRFADSILAKIAA